MNDNRKIKEYLDKWKKVALSDSARRRIHENLLEYARFHGVEKGVRENEEGRSIKRVPQRAQIFNNFFKFNTRSMTALIVTLALVIGGGTSYAAERAVPGDLLYPVKVEINEEFKSALAFSNEAEAELHTQLMKERLEEAETLAARGELNAETSSELSARLKNHYEEAKIRSDQAEASGNYETSATVRASLEGALRTHADVLSNLNVRISGNDSGSLITDIRTYADAAAGAQATATANVSADTEADIHAMIERTGTLIAQVEAELTQARSEISAEAYARANTRLDQAAMAHAEAKSFIRAEAYQSAYTAIQTAIRVANEVETFIDSVLRLNLEIDFSPEQTIDGILEGTLDEDIRITGENIRVDDSSDTNADTESDTGIDLEINATTDTDVDADIIDTDVETDTSVKSDLNL